MVSLQESPQRQESSCIWKDNNAGGFYASPIASNPSIQQLVSSNTHKQRLYLQGIF